MNVDSTQTTKNSRQSGYTLIEIIVVVGIMILMMGGGIAAFIQFQEKQAVIGAASDMKVQLRLAQTRARSGDVPEGCDRLQSYAVRTTTASETTLVSQVAVCDSGEVVRKEKELAPGITAAGDYDIRFLTLHGGVSGAETITLESTTGYAYEFEVTQGGEITEGGIVQEQQAADASPSASTLLRPSIPPASSPSATPSFSIPPRFLPQPSSCGSAC
jgi:type II secretory pathway pseudopilin PulG